MSLIWGLVFLASYAHLASSLEYLLPLNWMTKDTSWFSEYDKSSSDVWAYTFASENITLATEGSDVVVKYKCIASFDKTPYTYYVRKIGESYECVQAVSTIGAILQRTKDLGAPSDTSDICPAAMSPSTTATWLVKYPFSDKTDTVSPIPSNNYETTYTESAGDIKCSGDKASIAMVEGNKIKLDTCFSGNTSYEKPLKTTLTILAHVNGSILDSEGTGEIMLLGDFTTDPIRFYCARYKVAGTTVKLSLDISDRNSAKCTKSQTETSAETQKFVAFVLKEIILQPTTRPGQSTTTTTTTVKPTTTVPTTTTAPPTTSKPTPSPATTTSTPSPTTTSSTTKSTTTTTTTKPPTKPTTKSVQMTTTPEEIATAPATSSDAEETESPCSCLNGGKCVRGTSVCECPEGYTGDQCEDATANKLTDDTNKKDNTTMLIVILLVILAIIIIVIVIIAVVACQYRNRKKEEGILRSNFDTSFFGTKKVLPPGAVDGEELIP